MAFECSSAPDAAVICHRTLSPNFRIRLRTDDICLQVSTPHSSSESILGHRRHRNPISSLLTTSHNFETVPLVPGQMGSTVQHMWN